MGVLSKFFLLFSFVLDSSLCPNFTPHPRFLFITWKEVQLRLEIEEIFSTNRTKTYFKQVIWISNILRKIWIMKKAQAFCMAEPIYNVSTVVFIVLIVIVESLGHFFSSSQGAVSNANH